MISTDILKCRNTTIKVILFGNFISILQEFVFVKGSSHWEDAFQTFWKKSIKLETTYCRRQEMNTKSLGEINDAKIMKYFHKNQMDSGVR